MQGAGKLIFSFFLWSVSFALVLEMYWPVIQDEVGQNVNWCILSSLSVTGRGFLHVYAAG